MAKINSGVKTPFVGAYTSSLGGPEHTTVMIRATLEPEDKWPHGIWQNAKYMMFSFEQNGTLELFNRSHKIGAKFRKTRVKSVDDAVAKINAFVQVAGETSASEKVQVEYTVTEGELCADSVKALVAFVEKQGISAEAVKEGVQAALQVPFAWVQLPEGAAIRFDANAGILELRGGFVAEGLESDSSKDENTPWEEIEAEFNRDTESSEDLANESVNKRMPADDFQDGYMDSEAGNDPKHGDRSWYMMGYNSKKSGELGGTPGKKSSRFIGKADRSRRGRAEASDKGSYEPDKAYAAKKAAEGKLPKDQTNDQLEDKMAAMLEASLEPGTKVKVRDNRVNQELHPELVGKTGKVVQAHHEKYGLYLDVQLEGEESPTHMDWRDVEVVETLLPVPEAKGGTVGLIVWVKDNGSYLAGATEESADAMDWSYWPDAEVGDLLARCSVPASSAKQFTLEGTSDAVIGDGYEAMDKLKAIIGDGGLDIVNEVTPDSEDEPTMENFFAVADRLLKINEIKKGYRTGVKNVGEAVTVAGYPGKILELVGPDTYLVDFGDRKQLVSVTKFCA